MVRGGRGRVWFTHIGIAALILNTIGLAGGTASMAGPWDGVTAWETARVLRVVDGDTFIVRDEATNQRQRIRIIGMNAPEIPSATGPGQCGGLEAKDELTKILPVGTQVRLLSANQSSKGKNNRPQRVVLLYDERTKDFDIDVGWGMLERGWGVWYTLSKEAAMSQLYRDVVAIAQEKNAGIWNPNLCGELEQPDAQVGLRISRAPSGKASDEWVEVKNIGPTDVDLSDWMVRDSGNQAWYRLPQGSLLTPGEYRVIHTGVGIDGTPNPRDLYAGYSTPIYPEPARGAALIGDGAYLLDRNGNYRFWREYPCTYECEQIPHDGAIVIEDMSLGKKRGKVRASTQWVRFLNRGTETVCLDGYQVVTGSTKYQIKHGTCLAPGAKWLLRVGRGIDSPTTAYLNRSLPALWNSGSLRLVSDRDQTIIERRW